MRLVLALIRRMATLPGVRHLTRVAPLLRVSFALRAQLVEEPLRFALTELLAPGPRVGIYRRRGSGVAVAVRHRTADVLVLDEIFAQGEYDPPGEVERAIARLPDDAAVLDLGANIGLFGAWVRERLPHAAITAVEPDPANAALHRRTIAANRAEEAWRLIEACAATTSGTVRFNAGSYTTSQVARGEGGIELPALDVLPLIQRADFLKLDIEGSEWELLGDPRFADSAAQVIVLEYHPQLCPGPDPQTEAQRLLAEGGYEVLEGSKDERYGTGLLWALR